MDIILGLLPYLCLAGLVCVKMLATPHSQDKFPAITQGALIWSCIVWLASYVPSLLAALNRMTLAAIWLSCLAWICLQAWRLRPPKIHLLLPHGIGWLFALIGAITLLVGLVYPPNIHDILTYHMPRLMHWLQNQSVAPYPTTVDRQIGMAPFNSLIALQSVGLGRMDLFVNVGQWLAFAGCVCGAAHLALALGAGKKAALAAALFAATLPAAIIQASNMDSCLLVSFYICATMSQYLAWLKSGFQNWRNAAMFGLACGFAILSKGSAYPILFPLILLVAWHCLRKPAKNLPGGILAAAIITLLNLPHFAFTFLGTGNMLGGSAANILFPPSPSSFVTNILYNLIANFPFLLAGPGLDTMQWLTQILGVASTNANILPWGGVEAVKPYLAPIDGNTPNPLHVCLVFIAFGAAFFKKRHELWGYMAIIISSAAMFSLLLTWHPWITRIQIPLFILAAPVCGMWLGTLTSSLAHKAISIFLMLGAAPALFACVERPLVPPAWLAYYREGVQHFLTAPREQLLFNYAPDDYWPFREGADILASHNAKIILLDMGANGIEYPVWKMLENRLGELPRARHILPPDSRPEGYIWSKPRYNISEPAPLRILQRTGAKTETLYPAPPEPDQYTHDTYGTKYD